MFMDVPRQLAIERVIPGHSGRRESWPLKGRWCPPLQVAQAAASESVQSGAEDRDLPFGGCLCSGCCHRRRQAFGWSSLRTRRSPTSPCRPVV